MHLCLYHALVHSFSHWFLVPYGFNSFTIPSPLIQTFPNSMCSFSVKKIFVFVVFCFFLFVSFFLSFLFLQRTKTHLNQPRQLVFTWVNAESHRNPQLDQNISRPMWSIIGNLKGIRNSSLYLSWARTSLSHYISAPLWVSDLFIFFISSAQYQLAQSHVFKFQVSKR